MEKCDFSGWATRNDLLCGDGRTIRKDAFKDCDGKIVPLVYGHQHGDINAVLGHALLENRDEGVYAYCSLNDTESGLAAKKAVQHGDVTSLSIYANKLKQVGGNVVHGVIRELSLVLAGANPGAYIDTVMSHSDDGYEEIESLEACWNENIVLYHADDMKGETMEEEKKKTSAEETDGDETIADVFNTLSEKQKTAVYVVIGQALEDAKGGSDKTDEGEGDTSMKHNVFDNDTQQNDALMHSEILADAVEDAKMRRIGSLKDSIIQHAAINNIENIDILFPEAKTLNNPPEWIKDNTDYVTKIMRGVKHTPFSRVKSMFATLDEQEARARGYIKGNRKADLQLSVLKRTTTPQTVYIKMAMDRDDIIDITDFDVVAWQKAEMRSQLDREIARAILLGDGRDLSSPDKINEQNIRPIISDDPMYTITYQVKEGVDYKITDNSHSENDSLYKGVIRAAVKSRKNYKGSGSPTFFTTEDVLTNMLLIEDQNGRRIYESEQALATALRCREIVTCVDMESHTDIFGIIVNMGDYNVGADRGGAVSMFDDFDIDFNQSKYLMETRCSGALVKPYSAIVLKRPAAAGGAPSEVPSV